MVLLWGAQLVQDVKPQAPVLDDHLNIKNFFLDVVIYAKDQKTVISDDVQALVTKFTNKKNGNIFGNVALETLGYVYVYLFIYRCMIVYSYTFV